MMDKVIKKPVILTLLIFLFSFLIFGWLSKKFYIAINSSESLSGKLYFVIKKAIPETKEDKVVFLIKNNHTDNKNRNFIKKVIGLEGDNIFISNNNKIFINDNLLGKIKSFSKKGKKLYPIKSQTIPKGHFFVGSSHIDSYDSRYQSIGLIPADKIIGIAYEIF